MNGYTILRNIFKRKAASSATALLVGALSMGGHSVFADGSQSAPDPDLAKIYRHETLASNSTEPVGVQLVLALDTSGSMTEEELAIEFQATATALNSEMFRNVIKYKSGTKSVAIAVVDFNSYAEVRVGWSDIRGAEINDKPYKDCGKEKNSTAIMACLKESSLKPDKLDALAQEVATLRRRGRGGTAIDSAMERARKLYLVCPWAVTERRVLDIFGDGESFGLEEEERDKLAAMGVTINGFAIVNENQGLAEWYSDNVRTVKETEGPDGLYSQPGKVWVVARDMKESNNSQSTLKSFFGEVSRGMRQKISVEVAGIMDYHRMLARLNLKPDFPLPTHNPDPD